jgi:hypothetical protein
MLKKMLKIGKFSDGSAEFEVQELPRDMTTRE